jgi:vitamin B12 transporter
MHIRILNIALVVTLICSCLLSQENQEQKASSLQHEIVVTANRLETPAKEIATTVTVITAEELRRSNKTSVLEALEEILGVFVTQNGPTGGFGSVLLRGANSEHTLIMMDGVELNDPITPSRSFDLAHFSIANIERIEILRGPQSTLYGSDALSGVINIITKKGRGKPSFSLSGFGGTFGTYAGTAGLNGSTEKIDYSLQASYFQSTGFSAANAAYEGNEEEDGYKNMTLAGRISFRPKENLSFDLIVRSIQTESEIDNFAGAYGDDPNNIQKYNSLFVKGEFRGLFLRNRWEQKFSISLVDYGREQNNPKDEIHPYDMDYGVYKSRSFKLDWQNNIFLHETNTLTLGVNFQQEQGRSEYDSESIFGPFSTLFPLKKVHTIGFYAQDRIRVAKHFFATVGIRLDHYKQFGTSFTYRIAPAYLIKKTGTKLKATLGSGFKSPSLYQLYAPGNFWGPIGNNNLEPEKSTGWDIGIEQSLMKDKISLGATYFSMDFKNLIDYDFSEGFINVSRARSKGIELLFKTHLTDKISFMANYTHTRAQDKDTGDYLIRRPKNKFSAIFDYKFLEKSSIQLALIHTGRRDDIEVIEWTSQRTTLNSFTVLNASVSHNLMQGIRLFLRLDNIFNEKYELVKGYGTPGFSIYTGFNLNF